MTVTKQPHEKHRASNHQDDLRGGRPHMGVRHGAVQHVAAAHLPQPRALAGAAPRLLCGCSARSRAHAHDACTYQVTSPRKNPHAQHVRAIKLVDDASGRGTRVDLTAALRRFSVLLQHLPAPDRERTLVLQLCGNSRYYDGRPGWGVNEPPRPLRWGVEMSPTLQPFSIIIIISCAESLPFAVLHAHGCSVPSDGARVQLARAT